MLTILATMPGTGQLHLSGQADLRGCSGRLFPPWNRVIGAGVWSRVDGIVQEQLEAPALIRFLGLALNHTSGIASAARSGSDQIRTSAFSCCSPHIKTGPQHSSGAAECCSPPFRV